MAGLKNFRPDPLSLLSHPEKCSECGLIHPPVPRGECPVRKGREIEDEKVKKLVEEIIKILSDHPKKDLFFEMLEKTLRAFKILHPKT